MITNWWSRLGRAGRTAFCTWIVVALAGCETDPKTPRWTADCPQDSIKIISGSDTIRDIPIASEIDEIPEFHDCQRFRQGPTYGPLVAIWAATDLERQFRAVPPDSQPQSSTTGYASAEIFNFGRGGYAPLHINEGFSCVYLRYDTALPGGWEAKIVSLGDTAGPCREPQDYAHLVGQPLTVHPRNIPAGLTEADIPPVVRWDYDSVNSRQYIGIRCGHQWCEVGDPVLSASPTYTFNAASPDSREREISVHLTAFVSSLPNADMLRRRVLEIKGWYDEQRLGVETSSGMTATEIVGTIIPHPRLGALTEGEYRVGWMPSAYVHVTGRYTGKLSFVQGVSLISMCQGTACGVTSPVGCPSGASPTDPDQWWSKIEAPDGSAVYRCVTRMTHSVIPADAARWRWTERDEKLWVRCAAGCCTVN